MADVLLPLQPLAESEWIGKYKAVPTAKVRIYCFYGAGCSGSDFVRWQKVIGKKFPELELCVIEYPGRGSNSLPCFDNAEKMMEEFNREVIGTEEGRSWFHGPFVLMGMSTGARFAYGFLKEFINIGIKPEKMYACARTPPIVEDRYWVDEQPKGTLPLLNWVSEKIVESKADALKEMWPLQPEEANKKREQMWRNDLKMNCGRIRPNSKHWRVVAPGGKLVSKGKYSDEKMVAKKREEGADVWTTGEERSGKGGGKWLHVDAAKDSTGKGGWLLVDGKSVGQEDKLLEEVVEAVTPPDPSDQFWKAPIPVQVHYSDKDTIQPWLDSTGRLAPMSDWDKLCEKEAEYVKHEGGLHDEFIGGTALIESICEDVIKYLKLRP